MREFFSATQVRSGVLDPKVQPFEGALIASKGCWLGRFLVSFRTICDVL